MRLESKAILIYKTSKDFIVFRFFCFISFLSSENCVQIDYRGKVENLLELKALRDREKMEKRKLETVKRRCFIHL